MYAFSKITRVNRNEIVLTKVTNDLLAIAHFLVFNFSVIFKMLIPPFYLIFSPLLFFEYHSSGFFFPALEVISVSFAFFFFSFTEMLVFIRISCKIMHS